jgi:hypothetical protein
MKYYIREFGKGKDDILQWVLKYLPSSTISQQIVKFLDTKANFSLVFEHFNWDFGYVFESKERIDIRFEFSGNFL